MSKNTEFASKIGLLAATVGSAVGLGNIWRFPAEAQANGGAAFLLVYIVCVFLLCIPVMVAEFALGRAGKSDVIGSFKNIKASRGWWVIGGLAILASYLILSFYMVVTGWTLEYLWASLTGSLYEGVTTSADMGSGFMVKMQEMVAAPYPPLIATYIILIVNLVILIVGVQKGIERISNILMPILFLVLIIFIGISFTLPKAAEGLAFFLKPDFSVIGPAVFVNALGQAFFSLGLGAGILITYASYFPANTKITTTAVTVSLLDLLVAVMVGLIIFPGVTSFGLADAGFKGTTLVFITLPEVFANMAGTRFWSVLFFLSLLVAALTSTISMTEVTIRFIQDRFNFSRVKACLTAILPMFVISSLCSLAQGPLNDFHICGLNFFDFLDTYASNLLLPLGSLLLCVYMGWFAPKGLLKAQMSNDGTLKASSYKVIHFILKYVAPVLIFCILISNFL